MASSGLAPASTHPGTPENGRPVFAGAVQDTKPLSWLARGLAAYDAKTGFLNHCSEAVLSDGSRVIKHARLPLSKRDRNHLHTRFFLDGVFDCVCTSVAAHAFYPEYRCFHPNLRLLLQTSERDILHLGASSQVNSCRPEI